jgi:aspartyl-tRNA(Asn)/glutamyl-tRNA(Gln) amidotransferase subunit C
MKIKKDTIKNVAGLARMRLSPEEEALFSGQLNNILAYMDKINELDTKGIEPMSHVIAMGNVLREDTPKPCLSNKEALNNAPDEKDGFFKVPRIIE